MASPPKAFDVWFVAANTVYKQVPYHVVADWTQQGRLGVTDMLRPAGTADAWKRVDEFALLTDYLPRQAPVAVASTPGGAPAAEHEHVEFEPHGTKHKEAEDDEVDMIPLIDISMVLLVFFIIASATGALSPVDVPDMKWAGVPVNDPGAITISIEKTNEKEVHYSVRVGESAPSKENDRLKSPDDAIAALDRLLSQASKPPVVRIACAKDLPSVRVFELIHELKPRKEKGQINSFEAEVNEAPKK